MDKHLLVWIVMGLPGALCCFFAIGLLSGFWITAFAAAVISEIAVALCGAFCMAIGEANDEYDRK